MHLSLTRQPVAPGIVDPVVLGKVRAKQDQRNDDRRATSGSAVADPWRRGLRRPGRRRGDASASPDSRATAPAARLHFIINNQIGFTTDPRYSRSSPYPSDLAKMIEAPIFHVNGDDPEAVVHVAQIAIEFRQSSTSDVVIDMFCFRLYGHNEGDEPAFTQPLMYKEIRAHKSTLEIYGERLIAEGVVTEAEIDRRTPTGSRTSTPNSRPAQTYKPNKADWLDGIWAGLKPTQRGRRRRPRPYRRRRRAAAKDRRAHHCRARRTSRSTRTVAALPRRPRRDD